MKRTPSAAVGVYVIFAAASQLAFWFLAGDMAVDTAEGWRHVAFVVVGEAVLIGIGVWMVYRNKHAAVAEGAADGADPDEAPGIPMHALIALGLLLGLAVAVAKFSLDGLR